MKVSELKVGGHYAFRSSPDTMGVFLVALCDETAEMFIKPFRSIQNISGDKQSHQAQISWKNIYGKELVTFLGFTKPVPISKKEYDKVYFKLNDFANFLSETTKTLTQVKTEVNK